MASSSKAKTNKSVSILDVNPKGDMKKAALKTFAEVGISVIGGGVAGAVIGKPSFLIGLVLAGVGYYKGVSWLAPLGLGMMSTSHLISDKSNGVSGFDLKTETTNAKNRMLSFKDSLMQKTYLDKLIPSKKTTNARQNSNEESTEGFGSLEANLSALDDVERQLNSSANAFYKRRGNPATRSFSTSIEGADEPDFSGM